MTSGYETFLRVQSDAEKLKLNARQSAYPMHAVAQLAVLVAVLTMIFVLSLSADAENFTKYASELEGHG